MYTLYLFVAKRYNVFKKSEVNLHQKSYIRSTPCHLNVFFQNFQIEQLDRQQVLASVVHELRFVPSWVTTVRILVFGQMELDLRKPASHPLSLETHTNSRTSIPTNLDFLSHSWALLCSLMNHHIKDPSVWSNWARPVNTCIPPSFPGNTH